MSIKIKTYNKYFIFILFVFASSLLYAQNATKTATIYAKNDVDSIKIQKLIRFAAKNRYNTNTLEAIKKANQLATSNKYKAKAQCALGNYYFYASKLDSAETILNNAKILVSKNDKAPFIKASIRNSLSGIYRKRGDVTRAIETLLDSKKILENTDTLTLSSKARMRLKGEQVVLHNSLANFYNQIKEYDKAITYYDKAFDKALLLNAPANAGVVLSNKGDLLLNIGKYKEALDVLLEAKLLKIQGKASELSIANSNQNIAAVLLKLEKYKEALNYVNKAIKVYEKNKLDNELIFAYSLQGAIYYETKAYQKAIEKCSLAKNLAIQKNVLEGQQKAYTCLVKSYEAIGNYKTALSNYKALQKVKGTVFNEKNIKEITQLEMQHAYNSEKKIQELLTVAKEKENKAIIRNLIIGLVALLFVLLLLYRMNVLRKQSNKKLKEKNIKISETLAVNEILVKETHHRVKNNLQIITSLLNMQSRFLTDDKSKEIIKDSQNRIKSMALIHQKLYKEEHLTSIETSAYFTELISSLCYSYGIDSAQILKDIKIESLLLDVDTAIPLGLIMNELISNAFKHGIDKETGEFSLSFLKVNNELQLTIKDNGAGIPNDMNWEQSKSYGMKLVHTLSKKLNATITFINNNGLEIHLIIRKFGSIKIKG
jgi:two-component sensor histidine kinase